MQLPGKPAALLPGLALRPRRAHARDALAALLWGESDVERLHPDRLPERVERLARHALRAELWDQAR